MAMKRLSLCVLVMLIGAAAIVPLSASAGTGLQILIFVSPSGRTVGQTVDVNLESYLDGTATDIDTFDVQVGYNGTELTFTKTATGKYHAPYVLNESDFFFGGLSFHGSPGIGGLTKSVIASYDVEGGSAGWDVTLRMANFDQVGFAVAPGASVTFEARSYLSGTLADGGAINMTVEWMEGMTEGNATLVSTKTQGGVYQATVQVPADLAVSRQYTVEASLGSGFSAPSATAGFMAHPTPVYTVVTASSANGATVKVFVGGTAPVAGANLTLSGTAYSLTYPFTPTVLGPFSATTDANGQATLNPTWGLAAASLWVLNVTAGGKITSIMLTLGVGSTAWQPTPAFGFGCEVNLQTDPTGLRAGQTATLVFRVTAAATILTPEPVASDSIDRYVWRDGDGATTLAGSAMTDATGNFTMTYAIPANWTQSDELRVQVACPSGSTGSTRVSFGGFSELFESSTVTVTASGKLGGAVQITATYSGSNPLTGASGYAMIIPGNKTSVTGVAFGGGALSTGLVRSGSTFSGSINVPLWLGEGDYTVLAIITNDGATSSTADQTTEAKSTVIHLTPTGSTGGGVPSPGFLPGFEAPLVLTVAGLVGAVALRRRRDN